MELLIFAGYIVVGFPVAAGTYVGIVVGVGLLVDWLS